MLYLAVDRKLVQLLKHNLTRKQTRSLLHGIHESVVPDTVLNLFRMRTVSYQKGRKRVKVLLVDSKFYLFLMLKLTQML